MGTAASAHQRTYRATVDVTLPDNLDGGSLLALASIVLTALAEADVPVVSADFRAVPDV